MRNLPRRDSILIAADSEDARSVRRRRLLVARDRLMRVSYSCAFCGEENDVFVDPSGGRRQTFTEDCVVCCRPNLITITVDEDGEIALEATQEYEA